MLMLEMIELIVDIVSAAWPLALALATVALADRVREGRRREGLNRALHELRRPLQALALASSRTSRSGRDQLGQALEALGALDCEVNGGGPRAATACVEVHDVAEDAVARWQPAAAASGRRLSLSWSGNGSRVVCDPAALSRALDNLLANSLEHGRGPIRVDGVVRAEHLRLLVADGADSGFFQHAPEQEIDLRPQAFGAARHDTRRGYGLQLVADIALECGGRFAACRHDAGATAVIELPLAQAR